jgi:hypothetical protein
MPIESTIDEINAEQFSDIIGFEGLYMVSRSGVVKSTGNGLSNNSKKRILKPGTNSGGYNQYGLCKDGVLKNYSAHRLVALAFIPNPHNKAQVNHINGIKTDNRVENLEWATASENTSHAHKLGLNVLTDIGRKTRSLSCIKTQSKKCFSKSLDMIFNSIKDASAALCIPATTIAHRIRYGYETDVSLVY